jgi:MoaA/NifB/PqqE/SkfB family radical SAM enzyme
MIGNGKSDMIFKENLKKNLIDKGIDEYKIFTSYNMWKYGYENQFSDEGQDFVYKNVIMEIVGICNAKCPYCAVNSSFLVKDNNAKKFIEPKDFENAIDTLLDKNIIDKTSIIHLYNWGEPLMHPKINDILKILYQKRIIFTLSTNASAVPDIESDYLSGLLKIKISMSGFSQASYDRIHGFKFHKILKNIDRLINIIDDKNKIEIFFYVYQFNLKELGSAKEYFSNLGVQSTQLLANFNNYVKFQSYVAGTMNIHEATKASKELLLYYVDDFIKLSKSYKCYTMKNQLILDENLNYVTCCLLPKNHYNYRIGDIKTLSKESLIKLKETQPICKECSELGISYWLNNPLEYNDFIVNSVILR